MTDWVPETREVPEELQTGFAHETFPPPPVKFADWTEQLEASKFDTLRLFANGGIGNPSVELGSD